MPCALWGDEYEDLGEEWVFDEAGGEHVGVVQGGECAESDFGEDVGYVYVLYVFE